MKQESVEAKTRLRHLNRITLDAQNFEKIDTWLQELQQSRSGINATHGDILNWFISHAPSQLTNQQQEELNKLFFDQVRFLKRLLRDARKAKVAGEKVDLGNLLPPVKQRTPRRKKEDTIQTPSVAGDV